MPVYSPFDGELTRFMKLLQHWSLFGFNQLKVQIKIKQN